MIMKKIQTRGIRFSQAKKKVLIYYKKIKEAFPSDVANGLQLNLELVYKVVKELKAEGRLCEVP